jgi:hypothetical protein
MFVYSNTTIIKGFDLPQEQKVAVIIQTLNSSVQSTGNISSIIEQHKQAYENFLVHDKEIKVDYAALRGHHYTINVTYTTPYHEGNNTIIERGMVVKDKVYYIVYEADERIRFDYLPSVNKMIESLKITTIQAVRETPKQIILDMG